MQPPPQYPPRAPRSGYNNLSIMIEINNTKEVPVETVSDLDTARATRGEKVLLAKKLSLSTKTKLLFYSAIWNLKELKSRFESWVISGLISMAAPKWSRVDRAKTELDIFLADQIIDGVGKEYIPHIKKSNRDMITLLKLLDILELDSVANMSIGMALSKLTAEKPLTPLKFTEDEWIATYKVDGNMVYTNKRDFRYSKIGDDNLKINYIGSLKIACPRFSNTNGKIGASRLPMHISYNSFHVLTKSGKLKNYEILYIKDLKEYTLDPQIAIDHGYEMENPLGWWIGPIISEGDFNKIKKIFSVKENKNRIEMELSFSGSKFRPSIFKHLSGIGKEMYSSDFKITMK